MRTTTFGADTPHEREHGDLSNLTFRVPGSTAIDRERPAHTAALSGGSYSSGSYSTIHLPDLGTVNLAAPGVKFISSGVIGRVYAIPVVRIGDGGEEPDLVAFKVTKVGGPMNPYMDDEAKRASLLPDGPKVYGTADVPEHPNLRGPEGGPYRGYFMEKIPEHAVPLHGGSGVSLLCDSPLLRRLYRTWITEHIARLNDLGEGRVAIHSDWNVAIIPERDAAGRISGARFMPFDCTGFFVVDATDPKAEKFRSRNNQRLQGELESLDRMDRTFRYF